jgi:hypothetical protein
MRSGEEEAMMDYLEVRAGLEQVIASGDPKAYRHFITPATWAAHLAIKWVEADPDIQAKVCEELQYDLDLLAAERRIGRIGLWEIRGTPRRPAPDEEEGMKRKPRPLCEFCGGIGLVPPYTICQACLGTGKRPKEKR